MNDNKYNGWTNRATWLVNIWFNPESKDDVQNARETLDDEASRIPDFLRDFLCIDEVNWDELESHFEEDDTDAPDYATADRFQLGE